MSYRLLTCALLLGCAILLLGANAGDNSARYLVHVTTDKPIYRAGENLFVRAVVLSASDHKPMSGEAPQNGGQLQITGPKGETIASAYGNIQDSVAGFNWVVPEEAAGGQYTATVTFPAEGFPPAVRKFEVRAYRAPRLKGEIVFLRDGFGPGDIVKASLHVERAEGGIPVGATASADAMVDGAHVFNGTTKVDAGGNCSVEFKLPGSITTGDGTLSLSIRDGGTVEPIAKTIPILLRTVNLAVYPEGGDLVAGLAGRVYFEARTPAQKPADVVGVVVDSKGNEVAAVRTEHEGRGRFGFTPKTGETYAIKLSEPSGIDKAFALPKVKEKGIALQSDGDVIAAGKPVTLKLAASAAGAYRIVLSKRLVELSSLDVDLAAGEVQTVQLTPPTWADGTLIATVTSANGKPLAERLIFRKPARGLHIKIAPDKSTYIPAQGASLTVTTTDDDGKPVGAVVGITATDDSVLQLIEKRERAPRLPAMVFLENDVKDLADAEVYLDWANPKAALSVDLLLGTQGWRRFATFNEAKFIGDFSDEAKRVLATRQPAPPVVTAGAVDFLDAAALNDDGAARANDNKQPRGVVRALGGERQKLRKQVMDVDRRHAFAMPALAAEAEAPAQIAAKRQLEIAVVRIYAHDLSPNRQPSERNDFTETLYWCAGVKTDAKTGTGTISFKLNDAVTSFKVSADGFDSSGALGEASTTIKSVQPFYVESKLPLEVSSGDLVRLPITAVNGTESEIGPVKLSFSAVKGITIGTVKPFSLAVGARSREVVDVQIGEALGAADFGVKADAGAFNDSVTRRLVVKPVGFPTEIASGGMIDANGTIAHTVEIPDSLVAGSVTTSVALYPTPVGNLTEALARLLQEPSGCFEQTTSTTYPMTMAAQYFQGHSNVDPKLIARSNELLAKGYERLRGFECKTKGYEWFGESPGHECLSAWGLMQFTDMAVVRDVDKPMLERTRAWLLGQRDGKGGFAHERRALHTWIADPGCSNGYCTWALLECGEKSVDSEVQWLKQCAASDSNSYVTALAANALFIAGDRAGFKAMADKLAAQQDGDGHIKNAKTSVVGSTGESLDIETTSLAALAFLRDSAYAPNVEKAIHFLADSCKAGRYGSTQATVLALRAIVAYDQSRAHPTAAGKVQLVVDDHPQGEALAFDARTQGALKLPDMAEMMSPGKHKVELKMTNGSSLPYALAVSFNSRTPSSSDQCKIALKTEIKDAALAEGSITQANVIVSNRTDEILPSPIAIIGLPGGLEVRHDQLKELVKAERIAAYEVRGREVILYWRDIQPGAKLEIPLSLTAAIPGTYTAPASRAYLYYSDEHKQWNEGMKVTIAAKGE